jgi:hypothetical protein
MSWLFVTGVPALVGMTYREGRAVIVGRNASPSETIAFIKSKVAGDRTAVILDPAQSVYFAETGLASAVAGPGIVEMLLIEDRNRLIETLLTSPVKHLFIRPDEHGNLPDAYRKVQSAYRVSDTDKSYGLQYLVPREPERERP